MKWIIILVCLYVTYYTSMHAISLGRQKNKLGMYSVFFLSVWTLILPVLVLFKIITIRI